MKPSPLRAFANPIALATLGVGTVAAIAVHSVPLGALGALTYTALVAWELLGAAAPSESGPKSPRLPDPATVTDPDVRTAVEQILRARADREKVLGDTPDTVTSHLGGAVRSCDHLEENAAVLVSRAQDLHRWLVTQDEAASRAEVARLGALATGARDPAARAEYLRAGGSQEEHLTALHDVADARERICAHLSRIAATLSALPPKLVRMRALDAEAMDLVGSQVASDLASLDDEVRIFEQTLTSLNQGTS